MSGSACDTVGPANLSTDLRLPLEPHERFNMTVGRQTLDHLLCLFGRKGDWFAGVNRYRGDGIRVGGREHDNVGRDSTIRQGPRYFVSQVLSPRANTQPHRETRCKGKYPLLHGFSILLLLLVCSTPVHAATYRTSVAGGSTSGTGDRTVAITPAVGDLFIVFCAVAANTNSTPTASDNNTGGTYSLIAVRNSVISTVNYRLSAFVRDGLLLNTTSTTVTCTTGSNTSGHIIVVAVSGMLRSGAVAIKQTAGQDNQTASTTPAPAFSASALTGNLILGAIQNGTNPATMTIPSGFDTERHDVGFASDANGLEIATRDSGFTGTTVTWGSASASIFSSLIIELDTTMPPGMGRRIIRM